MLNPFDTGYYDSAQLRSFPFARVGEGVFVARNCTIVGLENITVGDNVRIDANSVLIAASGSLNIGNHVHIGIGCIVGARGGVTLGDYSSLSHGVRVLSAIDDYSGYAMTNSTLPDEVLRIHAAPVVVGRHVPIGTGSIVLAGAEIEDGAAVAALSLVNRSLAGWRIYSGNPAQDVGERSRALLSREAQVMQPLP